MISGVAIGILRVVRVCRGGLILRGTLRRVARGLRRVARRASSTLERSAN